MRGLDKEKNCKEDGKQQDKDNNCKEEGEQQDKDGLLRHLRGLVVTAQVLAIRDVLVSLTRVGIRGGV